MIAEINGKISQTGSNLHDRLEDNLTGNVFGALRYIPFNLALQNILADCVYPEEIADMIQGINAEFWGDKIRFWPYDSEGEIDVLIDFDDVIIGIEVKYLSALSSDDNLAGSDLAIDKLIKSEAEQSCNQLARESRIITKYGTGKTKILLYIADNISCRRVYEDVIKRKIIEKDVLLGYISWQSILSRMQAIKLENPFHQLIIEDVISLLIKKGFESFKNMYITLDGDIMPNEFYNFGISDSFNLDFAADTLIKGGVYYEFS